MKKLGVIASVGILLFGFQNCGRVNFEQAAADSSVGSPLGNSEDQTQKLCDLTQNHATRPTKVLFLIDVSGSNSKDVMSKANQPWTDDGKKWRLPLVAGFVETYKKVLDVQFGFVTFNKKSAQSLIVDQNQMPSFSRDEKKVSQALTDFANTVDEDETPYRAAFAAAQQAIVNDDQPDVDYAIIMLTDGAPSDYYDAKFKVDDEAMMKDAKALADLIPGHVKLHTVYYYSEQFDAAAADRLRKVAEAGDGQARTTKIDVSFDISQIVEKVPCNP